MSDFDNGDSDNAGLGAILANAQAAVAELADQYIGWVKEDMVRLEAAIAPITDSAGSADAVRLRAVYDVAHDIKGQGSTFGYPLVTEIANLLCRYTEAATKKAKTDRSVIDAHVTALHTVINNRVQGDAGELGREILEALRAAAAKSLA